MPSSAKIGDPAFDPYKILGLEQGCSDTDITKKYRKLALKLHPDKVQNLSQQEQDRISLEFHAIQEARAFLLEPEHAEARRAFDTKRASQRLRRQQDAVRESQMSERRKRMRDELKRKEEATKQGGTAQEDVLDQLKREGKDLREKHSNRAQEKQARKQSRAEKKARTLKEERQVRIKWSRKRMKVSPSEHSLAQNLSKLFGPVESVEMLGSKGNAALITFEKASSCRPCVDTYETSEEMRATFVGKRKQEYDEETFHRDQSEAPATTTSKSQDREGVEERKHRQAAERERLVREMEMEDAGHAPPDPKEGPVRRKRTRPFPLEFTATLDGASPLHKLEQFETTLFGSVFSPEQMKQMQMAHNTTLS